MIEFKIFEPRKMKWLEHGPKTLLALNSRAVPGSNGSNFTSLRKNLDLLSFTTSFKKTIKITMS